MLLRLRSPSGSSSVSLDDSATLADLQAKVHELTAIATERQDRFPPRPLDSAASPESLLSSLGLTSGDTVVVVEAAAPAPAPAASSSASVPQKRAASPAPAPAARPAPAAPPPATRPAAPASAASSAPQHVETDGGFLVLRQVPDDNSCLFRAIGLVLSPGETDAAASLRRVVAGAIQADPDTYSEVMLGRAPADYVATILKPSSWGGAIELAIFAAHFATEIWSVDVQTGRVDRFGEDAGFDTFVLLVYSGIHYDALTFSFSPPSPSTTFPPPNLDFDTTVFPKSQSDMLDAAQQLVAQLRAQHAYTDTATFTLKCGDCGRALRGEKEAREHAASSGHTSFTEYDG
ncbi:hypothetical protein Rhopal_001576-T1 [Rhodotorula paludigena]|uniref:Ubiquitin thioesterase OTU n=1 Tax=Rhodotorula paludigena TaxID=86838 RepID=A0AAV5G7Y4_9BASI|nr:hypothetical protein Rhopal_001576-T1 [Rhodotorula paludigena]